MRALRLITVLLALAPLQALGDSDSLIERFKAAEVSSVADAIEQLYGLQAYMHHDVRPLIPTRFA